MKGHWFYLIHCFADSEKLEKQLKKLREPWEYETVVNQIFKSAAIQTADLKGQMETQTFR